MKKIELKKKIVVNLSDEQKGQIVGGTGNTLLYCTINWCAETVWGTCACGFTEQNTCDMGCDDTMYCTDNLEICNSHQYCS
jgi:hypothetical protein